MKTDLEIFTPFAKKSKYADRIEGKNCIIYTRVSTKEQELGYSLETQKREIENTSQKNGFNVLAVFGGVFESAKTVELKEFNRMLKFARSSKEKVSYILVYSVDRFSRSGANAIYIANELRKENIVIFAVTQPSDTFTPTGKMQQNMQFIFSEYDNDLRREKCCAGMKEMLLNGYWPSKAPIGYDQITRKKRENLAMEQRQKITVNDTGKLIRKAFYWKATDRLTNVEIIQKLKNAGLNMWKQKLAEILANPFYCGIMSHNLLNGEVIEGKHEKLISREIFLKANEIKPRNSTWKHNTDFSKIPLKNFLKCEDCGSSFVGYMVKKKGLWYYKCNKLGCKCNRSAKSLNELFINKLKEYSVEAKYISPVKDEFIKYFNETAQEGANHLVLLTSRLNDLNGKIEGIQERFVTGEIDKELYQKFIGKFKKDRLDISTEMDTLTFENSNREKRLEKYCQIVEKLPSIWDYNGYKGKLELQELMFPQGILYNRENNEYRTPEINEVFAKIAAIAEDLAAKKKGDFGLYNQKSPCVPGTGLEPVHP
ncbi:MAG: recombinase family protein [Bacteroidetes bacterium]|nr:recombinase family protein [Bacteroidota bacterium]